MHGLGITDKVRVEVELDESEWFALQGRWLDDPMPRILDGFCDPGMIYCGGLHVCTLEGFDHSYNLDPAEMSLNRDRDIPSTIDIQFAAARLLSGDKLLKAAMNGRMDAGQGAIEWVAGPSVLSAWRAEFGDAIPVGISEQGKVKAERVRIVPDWLAKVLRKAGNMIVSFFSDLSPEKRLEAWAKRWGAHLPSDAQEELGDIVREFKAKETATEL